MGFSLQDVIGGSLLDGVSKIIGQFKMSPEEKANLQLQLQQNADAFTAAQNDYNAKLNDIAGQNIRAEEQSGDKYTARARPSVIWVGLFVIVWNYCILTTFQHWLKSTPIDLPAYFWEAWSAISLGYVFNRTADKLMNLPGNSSLKLPFGIQMSNDGGSTQASK